MQLVSHQFRGFDDSDVQFLSQRMELIPFRPGEMILAKGEPATWTGVVLEGQLGVLISKDIIFHLHQGDFLGELAVFESGVRSANVAGGSISSPYVSGREHSPILWNAFLSSFNVAF